MGIAGSRAAVTCTARSDARARFGDCNHACSDCARRHTGCVCAPGAPAPAASRGDGAARRAPPRTPRIAETPGPPQTRRPWPASMAGGEATPRGGGRGYAARRGPRGGGGGGLLYWPVQVDRPVPVALALDPLRSPLPTVRLTQAPQNDFLKMLWRHDGIVNCYLLKLKIRTDSWQLTFLALFCVCAISVVILTPQNVTSWVQESLASENLCIFCSNSYFV
jgi:hypothetical protein